MCNEPNIQATAISLEPSPNIFSAKTVAHTAELLNSKFVSCILDRGVDHGFNGGLGVQCAPFSEIEACFLLLDTYWVPSEKIRDKYEVAVAGYGVCESVQGQYGLQVLIVKQYTACSAAAELRRYQ